TARYMSPEQARGELISGATDLFSLGLVTYELATGRHPFAADTVFEVLHRIVTQVAIAPSAADSTLPHALDAVILAMLEKEPGRRPAAAEVADTLASLMCTAPTTPVRRALLSRSRRYVVGRESERAELRSAFEQVAVGAGLLISIGGEPGLGKTTVADE